MSTQYSLHYYTVRTLGSSYIITSILSSYYFITLSTVVISTSLYEYSAKQEKLLFTKGTSISIAIIISLIVISLIVFLLNKICLWVNTYILLMLHDISVFKITIKIQFVSNELRLPIFT